jgi:hypothetical protein
MAIGFIKIQFYQKPAIKKALKKKSRPFSITGYLKDL